jgi:two-component system, NarL family, sensor histidine kinase DegS
MLDQKTTGTTSFLFEELQADLEASKGELEETRLMLAQSRQELERLAQRSAAVNTQLQQVQARLDHLPAAEVRAAYEAALEAQQRLFVLRGRLDQMSAEEARLAQLITWLERLKPLLGAPRPKTSATAAATLEMAVQAQEAERARLARQMHDEPAQALSNFILQTEIALRLFDMDPVKARDELSSIKAAAASAFQKVRDFIFELRPMMLDDLGLGPTLNRYADTVREKTGVEVQVACSGLEHRLAPYQEVMLFRAVQELVSNALKHGGASQVRVQVEASDSEVRVRAENDGKGFDPEAAFEKGLGLKLLRERVEMLGGEIEITPARGQGMQVSFRMPALEA